MGNQLFPVLPEAEQEKSSPVQFVREISVGGEVRVELHLEVWAGQSWHWDQGTAPGSSKLWGRTQGPPSLAFPGEQTSPGTSCMAPLAAIILGRDLREGKGMFPEGGRIGPYRFGHVFLPVKALHGHNGKPSGMLWILPRSRMFFADLRSAVASNSCILLSKLKMSQHDETANPHEVSLSLFTLLRLCCCTERSED